MFSKSLKDFFKNPIITLPNIIYVAFTQIMLYLLIGSKNITDNMLTMGNKFDVQAAATMALSFLLFAIISLFVSPFIVSWSSLLVKRAVDGEKPNFIECLKGSLKYYWRILGATVLVGLILFAVYLVALIIGGITIGASLFASPEQINASSAILLVVLLIIFLLVVIFLAVAMMPIQSLIVYDDLSISDAFSKGFKFGIKKFFPLLGFSILIGLFVGLIDLILTFVFGDSSKFAAILTAVLGGYFTILITVFLLNLYREDKLRTEYNSNAEYTVNNNTQTYQQWNDIYNHNEDSNKDPQPSDNNEENKPDDNNNFRI